MQGMNAPSVSKPARRENMLVNLACNVVLPGLLLDKLSKPDRLGPVAGLVIAAVLAAIMSTVDSQLLVCASTVSHDLGIGRGDARQLLRNARWTVLVIGVGATDALPPIEATATAATAGQLRVGYPPGRLVVVEFDLGVDDATADANEVATLDVVAHPRGDPGASETLAILQIPRVDFYTTLPDTQTFELVVPTPNDPNMVLEARAYYHCCVRLVHLQTRIRVPGVPRRGFGGAAAPPLPSLVAIVDRGGAGGGGADGGKGAPPTTRPPRADAPPPSHDAEDDAVAAAGG